MIKYLKKCWQENKRKARECDRKMFAQKGVSKEQATILNELMFKGRIWTQEEYDLWFNTR